MIRFEVRGKPVPLSRTGHGQFGGKYLSAPSSQQIGRVIDEWEKAGAERMPDDAPLRLEVGFFFERPASHYGTGRNAGQLKPRFADALFVTARPDLDNLVKLVCEALQGNAFKDDSRVVEIAAGKAYTENHAHTSISIGAAR